MLSLAPLNCLEIISCDVDLSNTFFYNLPSKRNCDWNESSNYSTVLKNERTHNLYTVFLRKLLESKLCESRGARTTEPSIVSDASTNINISCGLPSRQMIGSDRETMTGSSNPNSDNQTWLTDVTTDSARDITHGRVLPLLSQGICDQELDTPLQPNLPSIYRPAISMVNPTDLSSQQKQYAVQYQGLLPSFSGTNLSPFCQQPSHLSPIYPSVYPTHYRSHHPGSTSTVMPGHQYFQFDRNSILPTIQASTVSPTQSLPHSSAFLTVMAPENALQDVSHAQYPILDKNREGKNSSSLLFSPHTSKQDKPLSKLPTIPDKNNKASQLNRSLLFDQPMSFANPILSQETNIQVQSLPFSAYQIPAGKEGSLKHRILRPSAINIIQPLMSTITDAPLSAPPTSCDYTEVPSAKHPRLNTPTSSKQEPPPFSLSQDTHSSPSYSRSVSSGSQFHHPIYFTKGSIIQLADGHLKQVEDLTTKDFIESAALSNDLCMDCSKIVKIREAPSSGIATLGFSVGLKQVQVTVEAPLEHPFFILNQGWSSCSPEQSLQRYRLPCSKLKVGDVCISLTHKTQQRMESPLAVCDKSISKVPNTTANPSAMFSPLKKSSLLEHSSAQKALLQGHAQCQTPDSFHHDTDSSQKGKRKRRWSAPDHFSF